MCRSHATLDEIKQRRTVRLQVARKHAKHLAAAVEGDGDDGMRHNDHSETASCSGSSMDSVTSGRSNAAPRRPMALSRSLSASTTSLDSHAAMRANGTASKKRPSSAPAAQFAKRHSTPHSPHSRRGELLVESGYESGDFEVGGQAVFKTAAGPKFATRSVPWA